MNIMFLWFGNGLVPMITIILEAEQIMYTPTSQVK